MNKTCKTPHCKKFSMKSEETFITQPKHDAAQNTLSPNRMSWLACTSRAYFAAVRSTLTKEKENTKSKIIALIVICNTQCVIKKKKRKVRKHEVIFRFTDPPKKC